MPDVKISNDVKGDFWTGGAFDLTGTLKVRFFTSSLALDIDNDHDVADLANEIASSAGSPAYTPGAGNGLTLGTPTVTVDDTNDRAVFDSADIVLGQDASGPTDVRSWAIVKDEALDADAAIACMGNNGITHNLQGGDLTVSPDATDGWMFA